jgi:hypothetical protein
MYDGTATGKVYELRLGMLIDIVGFESDVVHLGFRGLLLLRLVMDFGSLASSWGRHW